MDFETAFKELLGSSEASLQKVKRMLDANPSIAFIQHAGDKRFLYLSPKVESLLGVQIKNVLQGGLGLSSRIHPEDLPRLEAIYKRLVVLADDESCKIEFRFKPEGSDEWRWLRNHYSALARSTQENDLWLIGYCEDITDQKMVKNRNQESDPDAENFDGQYQMGQSQLYQAAQLASIGQLASTLAHQLFNPLATVIAEAQLLAREPNQSESARASSDAIMEAGWRAQRVVEALLILSQPPRDIRVQVSIHKTIRDALSLTESHFTDSAIELSTDLAQDQNIIGNPQQITDLWLNLLLVPFLFTEGSKIRRFKIQVQVKNGKVVTSFKNDGMHLTQEEAQHIFEPRPLPYRPESGHGLELTICREIVRQHGGILTARQDGEFTIFEVAFSLSGAI
jgi:PAS domain S-box-containing protein